MKRLKWFLLFLAAAACFSYYDVKRYYIGRSFLTTTSCRWTPTPLPLVGGQNINHSHLPNISRCRGYKNFHNSMKIKFDGIMAISCSRNAGGWNKTGNTEILTIGTLRTMVTNQWCPKKMQSQYYMKGRSTWTKKGNTGSPTITAKKEQTHIQNEKNKDYNSNSRRIDSGRLYLQTTRLFIGHNE